MSMNCSEPQGISNGFFVFAQTFYTYGTQIHYYCQAGFERSGTQNGATLTCDGTTGNWVGTVPTCTAGTTAASVASIQTDSQALISRSVTVSCLVASVIIIAMLVYIIYLFATICRRIEDEDEYGIKTVTGCWYLCCTRICMICRCISEDYLDDESDNESVSSEDTFVSEINISPEPTRKRYGITAARNNWTKVQAVKRVMGLRKNRSRENPVTSVIDESLEAENEESKQGENEDLDDGVPLVTMGWKQNVIPSQGPIGTSLEENQIGQGQVIVNGKIPNGNAGMTRHSSVASIEMEPAPPVLPEVTDTTVTVENNRNQSASDIGISIVQDLTSEKSPDLKNNDKNESTHV
ncbi:hypothetical protein FSP39_011624 [Pinctada imbricata]|uniref:Sushi domain-containing protein n=1 Tax=Pinctada imbricata TaxID=66713 RepID=A0AA88YCI0_PINIB|nr:hypothetical protein FSP39_011624 [Pinctada imbricata]